MENDRMQIEVLADGTIKVTTDEISPANHASAEQFTAEVARLAGGETTRERRTDVLEHGHSHAHTHHHN